MKVYTAAVIGLSDEDRAVHDAMFPMRRNENGDGFLVDESQREEHAAFYREHGFVTSIAVCTVHGKIGTYYDSHAKAKAAMLAHLCDEEK